LPAEGATIVNTSALPEEISRLLREFHIALEAADRSSKTISSYFDILDRYFAFLCSTNAILPIFELGRRELNSYLLYLRNCQRWPNRDPSRGDTGKLSPFTIQDHAGTIKAFWGWLFRDGHIPNNPLEKFPLPGVPKKITKIISADQFKKLLAHIDCRTPVGVRYYCILTLLYDGGARISELVNVLLKDVDFNLGSMRVIGKGKKERDIPVSRLALREVRRYLHDARPQICQVESAYLFPDGRGNALSINSVEQFITRLKSRAGLETVRIYPHLFRHSFGTEFINNGGSVFALKDIMGHSSLNTTLRYTHLQSADLRREHDRYSPLERLNKPRRTRKSTSKNKFKQQNNHHTYGHKKNTRQED
jgi:site-specific recombinase XerD